MVWAKGKIIPNPINSYANGRSTPNTCQLPRSKMHKDSCEMVLHVLRTYPRRARCRSKQRLRGRLYPLQSWQCELSTLEDEAPLELTPCALLVEPFAFHNEIRHEA